MTGLQKAKLYEITSTAQATQVGNPIEVQFNPASLKLNLSNTVEGGKSRTQQVRQFVGKASTELSFDLVFDTADEIGVGGNPRSVRELTASVERFVIAKSNGNQKQTPPKVRFEWGGLVIDGVISSLNIDFELFAPNGVPLRAKMSVSIREQDSKYMFLNPGGSGAGHAGGSSALGARVPGSGGSGAATTPGAPPRPANAAPPAAPGQPGTTGGGNPVRTATAMAGESLADFAARQGLDPNAWRALANQVENPLSLPSGLELSFDPALNAAALGTTARPETAAPQSVEQALGIAPETASDVASGVALTAAGGATAAAATAVATKADAAAASERRAFDAPAAAAPAASAAVTVAGKPAAFRPPPVNASAAAALALAPLPLERAPLRECEEPIVFCVTPVESEPAPQPYTDPRASTYGLGVPLRPRVRGAADEHANAARGTVVLRHRERAADAIVPRDPTAPPWVQLPIVDPARRAADRHVQARRIHVCGCDHSSAIRGAKCRCTSGK